MKLLSKSSFLGIAVGERSITVAEVAPSRGGARDRWEVRRVAEFFPPAGEGAGDPGQALGRFLRDNGFAGGRAVVGVPARWLVAREREVPPSGPEQAAEVLRMQAERVFSAELGDVAVDYAGAPDPSAPRTVLLMAMPRQQLQRVVAMVQAAGCEAVAVMPSTLALAAAATGGPTGGGNGAADGLVLNLSGDAVELSAHRAGAPRLLRHLPVRGPDLASQNGTRTAAVTSLAGEIRRTVATLPRGAAAGAGGTSDTLRLCDGVGLGPIDADLLARQAGVELRPGGDLSGLGLASTAMAGGEGADPRFAPALALALIGTARRADAVDFLHPKLARPRQRRFGRRGAWAAGVAAAVAVALLVLWLDARRMHRELVFLEDQIRLGQPDVLAAEETAARVGTARGWFDGRPPMLDVLREVTTAFPDEGERVYVTSFTFRDNRKGQINGKAADQRSILAISDRLKTNPAFADVKVLEMREAGGAAREMGFSISFTYLGPDGAGAAPAPPAPRGSRST
jgi:hypothetical protein